MSNVLVIADTHCPCMHDDYVDFLLEIQESWSCDRVVHIGDVVDWASINYHPKAPSLRNSEEEFAKAYEQVQCLYSAFPKLDWLVGNHDCLTERNAADIGMPVNVLKDYNSLWEVDKNDWTIHRRFKDLIIDGVIYRHGDKGKGGGFPAFANAQVEFQSVVQGHFHSTSGVLFGANRNSRYFGMQVGCGVDYRLSAMDYGIKYAKRPILGCGVVLNGEIPIFEPMLLTNKKGILEC